MLRLLTPPSGPQLLSLVPVRRYGPWYAVLLARMWKVWAKGAARKDLIVSLKQLRGLIRK